MVFFFKRVQNKLLKERKIVAGLQQKEIDELHTKDLFRPTK